MVDLLALNAPMLTVEPLRPYKVTVTQQRNDRGVNVRRGNTQKSIVRYRVAWSPSEAADIAGIPSRTLFDWQAAELVEPSFTWEAKGVKKPRWCNVDVLRLRVIGDLGDAGYSTRLRELVSWSLLECLGYYEDHPITFADIPTIWQRWFLPADEETAELLYKERFGCFYSAGPEPHDLADLDELGPLNLIEYPIEQRLASLNRRIEQYWTAARYQPEDRPPWMQ